MSASMTSRNISLWTSHPARIMSVLPEGKSEGGDTAVLRSWECPGRAVVPVHEPSMPLRASWYLGWYCTSLEDGV